MTDRRFYVYVHRRATDGTIFYVGKGKGQRYRQTQGRSEYWRRTVAKYGWVREIVCPNLTEHCAFCIEKILIASIPNLTNLSTGGEGGAGAKRSAKYIEYMRVRMTGKNNPMYGVPKTLTEDHKRKISAANKGRPKPPGTGAKVAAKLRGRKASEEMRAKLRAGHKGKHEGEKNSMYGATREKCPRFDPTEFIFYHPDHGEVVSTSYDIAKNYPVRYDTMRLLARGKVKKSKGWICLGKSVAA